MLERQATDVAVRSVDVASPAEWQVAREATVCSLSGGRRPSAAYLPRERHQQVAESDRLRVPAC
jgi:hypothetical protein